MEGMMNDGGGYNNPDQGADEALIAEALQEVLLPVCQKIDYLEEKLAMLEKVVMEELIGGIKGLYDKNMRSQRVEGLKSRFAPELGEEYEGAFGKVYPDKNLWEDIADHLESMKGNEGFDEEGYGKGLMGGIKAHLDKIREALPPGAAMKAEIESSPEPMAEENPEGDLADMVRKMARRSK